MKRVSHLRKPANPDLVAILRLDSARPKLHDTFDRLGEIGVEAARLGVRSTRRRRGWRGAAIGIETRS